MSALASHMPARASSPPFGRIGRLPMPAPPVLLVHLALLYTGALYTAAFVEPSLRGGRYRDGYYLADSLGYFERSVGFHFLSLFHQSPTQTAGLFPSLGLTDSLLYLQQNLASALLPQDPAVLVFVLNYALLLGALYCTARVARHLGLRFTPTLQLLVVANPMVWFSMVSLTKEIWGLFFVSVFALACVERRVTLLVVSALASMLAREWYFVVAAAMATVTLFRVSAFRLLIAVSVVVGGLAFATGVHDLTGFSDTRSLDLGQRSAHLMAAVASLQHYPFGQIIAFPVVLAFDLSAWLNGHQWHAVSAPIVAANIASSALFTILIVSAIHRHRRRIHMQAAAAWLFRVLIALAIVITLYPISQHRYLVPGWPLLVLLVAPTSRPHTERRNPGGALV